MNQLDRRGQTLISVLVRDSSLCKFYKVRGRIFKPDGRLKQFFDHFYSSKVEGGEYIHILPNNNLEYRHLQSFWSKNWAHTRDYTPGLDV